MLILSNKILVESDICAKVIKSEFKIPDSHSVLEDFRYKSKDFDLMLNI